MPHPLRVLPWLLFAVAPAQTFVVDAANGPGSHFTSIATAVAVVPDGSTLIVRPGSYGSFTIDGKGLLVLGGTGVRFDDQTADVRNTLPQQTVVLAGLTFVGATSGTVGVLTVSTCAGAVLVEDCVFDTTATNGQPSPIGLGVLASNQVVVRGGNWGGSQGIYTSNSDVVLEGVTATGQHGLVTSLLHQVAHPALVVFGGTVQIAGGAFQGGPGDGLSPIPLLREPNAPAIELVGGSLRVLAAARLIAGQSPTMPPVPVIDGTGTVRRDPQATLLPVGWPPFGNSLATQTLSMPLCVSSSAALGGTITAYAPAPAGNLVILVISLPGPAVVLPGIADAFWLAPAYSSFAAIGTPPAGQMVTANRTVPNLPMLLGFRVGWQAVAFDNVAGLQASNPSWSLIR